MSGFLTLMKTLTIVLVLGMQLCVIESRHYGNQKRFTQEDVCKETVKTVEIVTDCPFDTESMRRKSEEKKCEDIHDSCSKDPLVYHCLRYGNKLTEVCAPRDLISGKCCAQFNEGVGRVVEDYNIRCSECPFHYYSNESITYTTCFESIKSIGLQKITFITRHVIALVTKRNPGNSSDWQHRLKRDVNAYDFDDIEITTTTDNYNHSIEKKKTVTENDSKSHHITSCHVIMLLSLELNKGCAFTKGVNFSMNLLDDSQYTLSFHIIPPEKTVL
ncbi:uncharacterized protein LOC134271757 [Saccostrea cucullata]|uniref:uncharacterized protein LOC134271757 n=1 Tax=Saccostrea cuccullata TaxID=36930 RepID=UPI002ED516EF